MEMQPMPPAGLDVLYVQPREGVQARNGRAGTSRASGSERERERGMVAASRIAERIVRSLLEFSSLDEMIEWARRTGAVVETWPVPREGGVLYVEPREGALELLPGQDAASTSVSAWDRLQGHPGMTLEGSYDLIVRAARAAPDTEDRGLALKKQGRARPSCFVRARPRKNPPRRRGGRGRMWSPGYPCCGRTEPGPRFSKDTEIETPWNEKWKAGQRHGGRGGT